MKIKKRLKRSKKELMRKLKKQYNFKNSIRQFDNKFISPFGGFIDIMNFVNLLGLKKSIKNHFKVTDNNHRKYTDVDLFQRLLDTVILDVDRIDNVNLFYNDPLLRYLEELQTDPSPSTLRRELKACDNNNLSAIERISSELLSNSGSLQSQQKRRRKVTLLMDQTPISLFGNQEDAKKGFDHHKGKVCYQTVLSSVKETADIIKANLEPGIFKNSDEYFKKFFTETMSMIPPHLKADKIRLDSGFFSYPTLNLLEKHNLTYFIKGRMHHRTKLRNLPHTIPEDEWIKVPKENKLWLSKKRQYYSSKYKKSYQVIFIRELLEDTDQEQEKLFEYKRYKHYPIFSNSSKSELAIWKFYNNGALIESFIKELKNEFFLDKIPMRIFIANSAFTKIKALAYNILNIFKRLVLKGKWTTKSAKTIRNWIIRIPVIVTSFGKGVKLNMAQNIKLQQFILDIENRVFNIAADFLT